MRSTSTNPAAQRAKVINTRSATPTATLPVAAIQAASDEHDDGPAGACSAGFVGEGFSLLEPAAQLVTALGGGVA